VSGGSEEVLGVRQLVRGRRERVSSAERGERATCGLVLAGGLLRVGEGKDVPTPRPAHVERRSEMAILGLRVKFRECCNQWRNWWFCWVKRSSGIVVVIALVVIIVCIDMYPWWG